MPLPPLVFLALLSGFATALAGRQELKVSPRPVLLTRSFAALCIFSGLVLIPAGVYFYVFHGDWFLLYAVDVQRVPSAVALVGFLLTGALGGAAFLLAAVLVRNQREAIVGVLLGICVVGAVAVVTYHADRLAQVGTFAQFHGQFGLTAFEDGPLLTGSLTMSAILIAGLAFLLARLHYGGRRGR